MNLKEIRKAKGLTLIELADRVGVSAGTISRWESGEIANMRRDRIALLANALGVQPTDLLDLHNPIPKTSTDVNFLDRIPREIKIPLYGSVAAGEGGFADNHIEDYITVIESDFNDGEYFALRVFGDSMYPKIEEGDIIIVRKAELPVNREICVILVNGDEATVKEVLITSDGITLNAFNRNVYEPHFYSNKEIESLPVKCVGVVKEIRRRL